MFRNLFREGRINTPDFVIPAKYIRSLDAAEFERIPASMLARITPEVEAKIASDDPVENQKLARFRAAIRRAREGAGRQPVADVDADAGMAVVDPDPAAYEDLELEGHFGPDDTVDLAEFVPGDDTGTFEGLGELSLRDIDRRVKYIAKRGDRYLGTSKTAKEDYAELLEGVVSAGLQFYVQYRSSRGGTSVVIAMEREGGTRVTVRACPHTDDLRSFFSDDQSVAALMASIFPGALYRMLVERGTKSDDLLARVRRLIDRAVTQRGTVQAIITRALCAALASPDARAAARVEAVPLLPPSATGDLRDSAPRRPVLGLTGGGARFARVHPCRVSLATRAFVRQFLALLHLALLIARVPRSREVLLPLRQLGTFTDAYYELVRFSVLMQCPAVVLLEYDGDVRAADQALREALDVILFDCRSGAWSRASVSAVARGGLLVANALLVLDKVAARSTDSRVPVTPKRALFRVPVPECPYVRRRLTCRPVDPTTDHVLTRRVDRWVALFLERARTHAQRPLRFHLVRA